MFPSAWRLGAKELQRLAVLPLTTEDWVNFIKLEVEIGGQTENDTMSYQFALQFNGIDLSYFSTSIKLWVYVRYSKYSGDDLRLGDVMRFSQTKVKLPLTMHNDVKVGDFFQKNNNIYKVKFLRGGGIVGVPA